jgi:hypothetical protein
MKDQRPRVKYRGTPEAVWLLPTNDGELHDRHEIRDRGKYDRYELWANGAITVCRNPASDFYRTLQKLDRPPQKR